MKKQDVFIKMVAPDGGWGWLVVLGSAMVNLATRALEPSFGLLFGDLLTRLEVATTGAAIINSTLDAIVNFSGLFVGPLIQTFSYRKVSLVGSLLYGLGLILTAPAASMGHILATYSIIGGLGVGMASSATFVALNHYFVKKRGQAVGLSMAGAAMGMLAMPQAVRFLLDWYDFQGAVLVLGALALNSVVGSALLQPAEWHMVPADDELEEQVGKEMETIKEHDDETEAIDILLPIASEINLENGKATNGVAMNRGPTFPRIMSSASVALQNSNIRRRKASVMSNLSAHMDFTGSFMHIPVDNGDSDNEDQGITMMRRVYSHHTHLTSMNKDPPSIIKRNFSEMRLPKNYSDHRLPLRDSAITMKPTPKPKANAWKKIAMMLDLNLLKDPVYLNLLLGLSLFYVAEQNFKMVTPFFLASLGYSRNDTAFCLSMTAISDILARIILPPICDKGNVSKRFVFLVAALILGITRTILAEQTEWIPIMAWLSVSGFFRGVALSNFTLTISEHCSLEKLPAAFGLHMVAKGIFVVALGPLLGVIRDQTGSYPFCIHSQTLLIFLCGLAWSGEFVIKCFRRKPETEEVIIN